MFTEQRGDRVGWGWSSQGGLLEEEAQKPVSEGQVGTGAEGREGRLGPREQVRGLESWSVWGTGCCGWVLDG